MVDGVATGVNHHAFPSDQIAVAGYAPGFSHRDFKLVLCMVTKRCLTS